MAYVVSSGKIFSGKGYLLQEIYAVLANPITGAGWTLVDQQDGSGYRVYSSPGELSDRIPEYVKIYSGTTGLITFQPHYYWNSSTHVGYGTCTNYGGVNCSESYTNQLYMYASKNMVFVYTLYSGTWSWALFGHLPNRYWKTIATVAAPGIANGSSVTANLTGITGTFVPGHRYMIVGGSGEGRETVTVDSVGGGSVVINTVQKTTGYAAGALIGEMPSTFGVGYWDPYAWGGLKWNLTCYPPADYVVGSQDGLASINEAVNQLDIAPNDSLDPDIVANGYTATPMQFGGIPGRGGMVGYSDGQSPDYGPLICGKPPGALNSDTLYITSQTTGTATGGSINTLVQAAAGWSVNAYQNLAVVITAGSGVGQIRKILSNTSDTLTVSPDWVSPPVAGNTNYRIVDQAYRLFTAIPMNPVTIHKEGV